MRRSDTGYMPNQWVLSRRHGRSEPTDRPSRRPKLGPRQLAAFEVQHRALSHVNLSFIACVSAHNGLIKPAKRRSAVHPLLVLVRAYGVYLSSSTASADTDSRELQSWAEKYGWRSFSHLEKHVRMHIPFTSLQTDFHRRLGSYTG